MVDPQVQGLVLKVPQSYVPLNEESLGLLIK